MTGPLDESRHAVLRIGADGTQVYVPKPIAEMTATEELNARDISALERWMDRLYAQRAAQRAARLAARRNGSSGSVEK